MYLSSIQIKNFRCFDDQVHTIEFNPGLTVLVGENDSGKSAILDAIKNLTIKTLTIGRTFHPLVYRLQLSEMR